MFSKDVFLCPQHTLTTIHTMQPRAHVVPGKQQVLHKYWGE